jgi:ABC-type multidrug transport system fused ATPase/permease subunit
MSQVNNSDKNVVYRSFKILDQKDQIKLFAISLFQFILGLFDLLGVLLIGLLAALSIQGIQDAESTTQVEKIISFFNIENLPFQMQAALLGSAAAFVLIFKTILSVFVSRKTFQYLSMKGALLSSDLIRKTLSQNITKVREQSSQETLFVLTSGVKDLFLGTMGSAVNLFSDLSILFIIVLALFIVEPISALATVGIFAGIGFILYRLLQLKAANLSRRIATGSIHNDAKILEVLRTYRESVVHDRRHYYANEIGKVQLDLSKLVAEINFMPYISKFVMESAVVLSALILGAIVFTVKDAVTGIATLSIFLAATSRIASSALRVQQGLLSLKTSQGSTERTLDFIQKLHNVEVQHEAKENYSFEHNGFSPTVLMEKVNFQYPKSSSFKIEDASLRVSPGETIAIVGPSGGGKTTLVDLILGILDPLDGSAKISEMHPIEAARTWPGSISYVPQDTVIINGTWRENISLGYPLSLATDEKIKEIFEIVQLSKAINKSNKGFDGYVGENGSEISGGQRQRLGIARALFTNPKLLILDEATSALDGKTESDLSNQFQLLHGKMTMLIVAHRLSTVKFADKVAYIDAGRIAAFGTIKEVRSQIADFDLQAKLSGF